VKKVKKERKSNTRKKKVVEKGKRHPLPPLDTDRPLDNAGCRTAL